ncbi:hypothetical protein POM88_037063 [Heracleum sosnowskyi]|uniref:Uncharacterized protein n=1 Tax=Heracleum sosnowskyi TaxID=360622 RepID=A0AAD8HPM7_9APIA|nr:hypothetical protein POM88_037063 [Heracleum sosnowskyi]
MVGVIPNKEETDRLQQLTLVNSQKDEKTDCFQQLPIKPKRLIFLKLISSGHYSDIKFLCRCSLVSKSFCTAIPFVSHLFINHYCLNELCEFLPRVLKKFKWVQYLYVHHESPRSLNNFKWNVTFQLSNNSAGCVTYVMAALSYNCTRERSRDDKMDFCLYSFRFARPDTRIQCVSTERYVMQMTSLHDMLMLCIRRLPCLRQVHVTDDGNHGTLVLDEELLDVLRDSPYERMKARRKKLAWFVANLPMDEFIINGITSNIVLKWKDPDEIADYNGIATFFNLQQNEMVYDKAILSLLQHHRKTVQEGYNNKLVYPDIYEAISYTPLPVSDMYSKGPLKFGAGLKYQFSSYVARLLPRSNKIKAVVYCITIATCVVLQQMMHNDFIRDMHSCDSKVQLTGTKNLAGMLAKDPRLGDLRSNDVHYLIGLLEDGGNPELQFYAALALSYVDSDGAQIIREEAIPLLVDLMISNHVDTQMRVVFTKLISKLYMFLVDAIGDLHEMGALELLEDLVYSHQRHYYELLNCATFFAIVCRAKSNLSACEIMVALRTAKLILQYGDDKVRRQALLALSYLSHGSYVTLEPSHLRCIVELISLVDPLIIIMTLQVIGNIMAWGSYKQKKLMLEKELLKKLHSLSHREYKILRYEACRIIQIIEKESKRQDVSLSLGIFKIHKKEGTALCSTIENEKGEKIDLAEDGDDFLETLPIKVDSSSLDMSSFMPLSKNEENFHFDTSRGT